MRPAVLKRILSRLLFVSAAAHTVPLLFALIMREGHWLPWLLPAAVAGAIGGWLARQPEVKRSPRDLRRREGFLAVSMSWLVLVLFTSAAFYLTGEFETIADTVFESMSGWTTTGATILDDIEAMSRPVLLMRSLSHWLGGLGIIVLSVAILPGLAVGGMQLFSAEATGLEADKLAPRIAATARRLWSLYVGLTVVLAVLLMLGGISMWDAINHAMSTLATGGFSTLNASVAGLDSLYAEILILVFMFLGGIGFTLHYRAIIRRNPKPLLQSPEVRLYAALMLAATVIIGISLYTNDIYDRFGDVVRYASFQAVSIMTTTGFGTADFDAWPHVARVVLVGLMLIGGCAGSTAGGSKVIRLYVVSKHAILQLHRLVRPRLVAPLKVGDRPIPREATEAVLGFYLLSFAAITGGAIIVTALGMDFESGVSAAVATVNTIGPGLGTVGAADTFADVPTAGKYALSFGMLLGRLEIYTVLVLFTTHFWRRG
jgi:trk system potassium uptake protein